MANSSVTLVEVGLRDGLQNEKINLPIDVRVEMARQLVAAGHRRLELGAFVRADKVPQMAGSADVIQYVLSSNSSKKVQYSALVPNEKGMLDALKTGIKEIAIFTSCSESFSQKNIDCSIEESFQRFIPVMQLAKKNKVKVRGYLSVCFGCPFEGNVSQEVVVRIAKKMHSLGVYEISIGDTIGVATPGAVTDLFKKLKKVIPVKKLAGHFHDTRGTALVNIFAAYQLGVRVFDTSLGGLGGCPYAPGATGNVAIEDVVYMFDGMKVKTGLNLDLLLQTNRYTSEKMGQNLPSKVGRVGRLKPLNA